MYQYSNGNNSCYKDYKAFNDENVLITTEDDINYYINSKLKNIKVVDFNLGHSDIKRYKNNKLKSKHKNFIKDNTIDEYGGVVFIDINTSKGILQLVVYNFHTGYYGANIIFYDENKEITNSWFY